MDTLDNPLSILEAAQTTSEQALELFDALEPVDLDFMLGRWCGSGVNTRHPLDGILELSNWYGKEFVDGENVHPLLFLDGQGNVFQVAPNAILVNLLLKLLPLGNNIELKAKLTRLKPLLIMINLLMKTESSQARLRMVEHRGQVTAAMLYDYLPIIDFFRKIDEQTILGIMDCKNLTQPFFFLLKRCPPR
jgi:hypothetical protein